MKMKKTKLLHQPKPTAMKEIMNAKHIKPAKHRTMMNIEMYTTYFQNKVNISKSRKN
jgi:hypothetical protein